MQRAMSVYQIINKKRDLLQFDGDWLRAIGCPELRGSWLIWGHSGHGKSTFVMQLCKYLTKFGRVAYNSLEEGDSESIKLAFIELQMEEVSGRLIFLDREPIVELAERLRKHKSPRIVIIDSFQYADLNVKAYKALINEFANHLFIIVSHAEGKEPEGKTAKKVRFDAFVKIFVEGYVANVKSRYKRGNNETITIWEEGANLYHGNF